MILFESRAGAVPPSRRLSRSPLNEGSPGVIEAEPPPSKQRRPGLQFLSATDAQRLSARASLLLDGTPASTALPEIGKGVHCTPPG